MPRGRSRHQVMDPAWKVMNPASFSATFIVLIFACLCKGLQSQNSAYHLAVPSPVSVQRGLCVHIPCSFTYDQRDRTSHETLYGYWFQKRSGYTQNILVATNDHRKTLYSSVQNRFQLTGEVEEGNCSFSILDAESQDDGEYYFRIEDNLLKYSYVANIHRSHTLLRIFVTEVKEKPQIRNSSVVLSGKEAVFTCSVPGPCTKIWPSVRWATTLTGLKSDVWSLQHSNGSWTYGSNFTFTPSLNDQGEWLTCQFWYPNIREYVKNTIRIDVADPPKTVEISTNATNHGHLAVFCSPDSAVAREGESISLQCEAESRPEPTLSWMKGNKTLSSTRQGKEHVLLLSEIRPEDAGEYQCQAETPYGSARKILHLCVLSNHGSLAGAGVCGALVAVILCVLCLILIKFYKQRKEKASSKSGDVEVLNSANGGLQRANDGSLIYSNVSPLGQKSPRANQSKAARERISPSSPRVPSLSITEPEDLHYATLEFSKVKAKQASVPEELVEYSAVKQI